MEYFKRNLLLLHQLFGCGIECVTEVVGHHGTKVHPSTLVPVQRIDVLGDWLHKLTDNLFGNGGIAFYTEWQSGVVYWFVADKALRRPEHSILGTDAFQRLHWYTSGCMQYQCVVEMQFVREIV